MMLLLLFPFFTHASTFVGNGGGAGDIELSVTKKQIEQTFKAIELRAEDTELTLCKCNRMYDNRSVCAPVRPLDQEQRKFCTQALVKQTPQMLNLVKDDSVSIRWTNDEIRVPDRGQTRAVDAVTNREKREITLNLKRFLSMKPFERVFLVSHEYMHLTTLDGKPMVDEGAIGPFDGDQGGRRLLNAMGASVAMLQGEYPQEIKKFRGRLLRSQSWKPWWIETNFGEARMAQKAQGTFASQEYNRWQLAARYALGNWVLITSLTMEGEDRKALQSIQVKENKSILGFGAGYRIFPFGDPETYFGQSHFLAQVTADWVSTELVLSEVIEVKEKRNFWGTTASLNYYLPFLWGFWFNMGLAYEWHPHKYKRINVRYDKNIYSHYFGVSYAF